MSEDKGELALTIAVARGLVEPRQALEAFLTGAVFVPNSATTWKRVDLDAGPQEFFRRNALVERKLRSHLAAPPDPGSVQVWRDRIIESRLKATRQRSFFDSVRKTLDEIKPPERASPPADFIDCSPRVLAEINQLEQELDQEISSAYRMFDAVAGSLPVRTMQNNRKMLFH